VSTTNVPLTVTGDGGAGLETLVVGVSSAVTLIGLGWNFVGSKMGLEEEEEEEGEEQLLVFVLFASRRLDRALRRSLKIFTKLSFSATLVFCEKFFWCLEVRACSSKSFLCARMTALQNRHLTLPTSVG